MSRLWVLSLITIVGCLPALDKDECGEAQPCPTTERCAMGACVPLVIIKQDAQPADTRVPDLSLDGSVATPDSLPPDFQPPSPHDSGPPHPSDATLTPDLAINPCTLVEYDCEPGDEILGSSNYRSSMRLIPAGEFEMGSPVEETEGNGQDERQHLVTITRPYLMATTEVTAEEWAAMAMVNPTFVPNPSDSCANCPVQNVNWYEAAAYANAVSAEEDLAICYRLPNGNRNPRGLDWESDPPSPIDPACLGYRLPTEAEWEYAARAGTTTAQYAEPLRDIAWYGNNSGQESHPVAGKQPNPWGLYDMLGNVWEWTDGRYGFYQPDNSPSLDPTGPTEGDERVLRGCAWNQVAIACRAASRESNSAGETGHSIGFRLVRTLPQ